MWVWTLDDRLVNLDVMESIEVIEVYPDDVDPAQLESGAAEPDLSAVPGLPGSADAPDARTTSCPFEQPYPWINN